MYVFSERERERRENGRGVGVGCLRTLGNNKQLPLTIHFSNASMAWEHGKLKDQQEKRRKDLA